MNSDTAVRSGAWMGKNGFRRRWGFGLTTGFLAVWCLWGASLARAGYAESMGERKPLKLLFYLNFEDGFTARRADGTTAPLNDNLPKLVPGIHGRAARFQAFGTGKFKGTTLQYPAVGNLRADRGAISLWVQPSDMYLAPEPWQYIIQLAGKKHPALSLWSYQQRGLRFDTRDETNKREKNTIATLRPSRDWRSGEWHHVVCCWDVAWGTRAYVDGVPVTHNTSGDKGVRFQPRTWTPSETEWLLIGARALDGRHPWFGAVDEIRVFNRPLTDLEVRTEFVQTGNRPVKVKPLDAYMYSGTKETCRIQFDNFGTAPLRLVPRYVVKNAAGAEVASGSIRRFSLKPNGRKRVRVKLVLPKAGAYTLTVEFECGGQTQQRDLSIWALPEKEESGGSGRQVLVTEMDPVAQPVLSESAPSRVVQSPIGTYREAGTERNDRFALEFTIQEPNRLHVAEFWYPDDRPRTMDIVYQSLEVWSSYQGQAGVLTGLEYPCSGKMIPHTITFWPRSKRNTFIIRTAEKDLPAAIARVKIFRLPDGFSKLDVKPFTGSVAPRSVGMYYEDPVLPKCFGVSGEEDATDPEQFPGFETTTDRLLDFLQSFGQNTFHYPIAWYLGPIYYGADTEPIEPPGRGHAWNFPEYLCKRLHARGMTFEGWFHCHELASLASIAITDEERVYAGEETILNMRNDNHLFYTGWHHRDCRFNPLDPRVQKAVKDMLTDALDRFADEPAFTGITLNSVRCSVFTFGSIESGYNDINLRRFQEDTGHRIPVDPADRERFSKAFEWLKSNAWEDWVSWRCRMIHKYLKEMAGMIRARRKDLKLRVVFYVYDPRTPHVDYLAPERHPVDWYREQGLDPALFRKDKDIVLVRAMDIRHRHRRGHRGDSMNVEDWRTGSLAPEMLPAFKDLPHAAVNIHDVYWENAVGKKAPLKLSKQVKEHGWRVSNLNPKLFHCLEQYVVGLENFDALTITKGGFCVGLYGMEPYLAQFATAFRALPALRFKDVEGLEDPVRVRQRVVDGKNYFYVLNRLPVAVEAVVQLKGRGSVFDLVADQDLGRLAALSLELEPYELRSYRGSSRRPVVSGGSASVPQELLDRLKRDLDLADNRCRALAESGIDVESIGRYLRYAKECWSAKRYARLLFLFQESWFGDLRRLKQKTGKLKAFMNAPPGYLKSVQKVRTLQARKVEDAVRIDGKLDEPAWQKAPAFDRMSDFVEHQGKLLVKPATNTMSVRLLHDEKNLYIGVHCREPDPGKIIVRKRVHDSPLWADEDAVEIFLRTPQMGRKGHGQFAVSAGGSRTDLLSGDIKWNPKWDAAAQVTKDGWTAEAVIPFAALAKGATPASGWSFNIARTRRSLAKSAMVGVAEPGRKWKCESLFAKIAFE